MATAQKRKLVFSREFKKSLFEKIKSKYQDKEPTVIDYGGLIGKQEVYKIKGFHALDIERELMDERFEIDQGTIRFDRLKTDDTPDRVFVLEDVFKYSEAEFDPRHHESSFTSQKVVRITGNQFVLKSGKGNEYEAEAHPNADICFKKDMLNAYLGNSVEIEALVDWTIGRPYIVKVIVHTDELEHEENPQSHVTGKIGLVGVETQYPGK